MILQQRRRRLSYYLLPCCLNLRPVSFCLLLSQFLVPVNIQLIISVPFFFWCAPWMSFAFRLGFTECSSNQYCAHVYWRRDDAWANSCIACLPYYHCCLSIQMHITETWTLGLDIRLRYELYIVSASCVPLRFSLFWSVRSKTFFTPSTCIDAPRFCVTHPSSWPSVVKSIGFRLVEWRSSSIDRVWNSN